MSATSQAIERLRERAKRNEAKINRLKREYDITDPEKVNVTPEQIEILQNVLRDFIESQGNVTVKQFRMWVRENDALDTNEKTAIDSVLDDLLNEAPSDWRVEGEFGEWLDRRIEDVETVNIEIPVAGRANEVTETTIHRPLEPETETKEVEIPVAGRSNEESTIVEKEVPVTNGMEKIEEWQAKETEMKIKSAEERVNRQREARKRLNNESEREIDEENIPAGGRTNWESRQNQREESDDGDSDIPAGGRSNWEARQEGDD